MSRRAMKVLVPSFEQILHSDLGNNAAGVIHILFRSICGDHGWKDRFLRFRLRFENRYLTIQFTRVFFVNGEFISRKFHFAEVDAMVSAVKQEVDLRAGFSFLRCIAPTRCFDIDPADS